MGEAAETLNEAGRGAEPTIVAMTAPVVEVTLLEDRGLVRRRGSLMLPPGRSRVRLEGAAPVLVDKTLAAALSSASEGTLPPEVRVRDAKVERRRLFADADRPQDVASLRAKLRDKVAERTATAEQLARVEGEVAALAGVAELALGELAEDVGWGRSELSTATRELDDLEAEIASLGDEVCTLQATLTRLDRERADLERLGAAHEHVDSRAAAAIVIELLNPTEDSLAAVLTVDYLVPGALWRPCHTAQLVEDDAGARVHLRTDGCVWQATGEDWTDVELIFSTERPSLGVDPPILQTDELYARKRGSQVDVAAREQTIATAGLGSESGPREADDELPGIDDGGDALSLRGRTKVSVPGDGRPHRVPIASFEAEAETSLICAPELVPAVVLRSRQLNQGAIPVLAGPVDLVRGSGLVGRTSTLFVAPGERFELGWGPDVSLRVVREVEFLETSRRALSSWTRKPRRIAIKLSNLGARPATLQVQERVPVSEIEKVEVEHGSASRNATPDDDGLVTWEVPLRGFGRETLELEWTLVVHDDVAGL